MKHNPSCIWLQKHVRVWRQTRYNLQSFGCNTSWWSLTVVKPESSQFQKAFYKSILENQYSGCAAELSLCPRSSSIFDTQNICASTRPRFGTAILWSQCTRFVQLVVRLLCCSAWAIINASLVSYYKSSDTHKASWQCFEFPSFCAPRSSVYLGEPPSKSLVWIIFWWLRYI